jgi:hypothetical protein
MRSHWIALEIGCKPMKSYRKAIVDGFAMRSHWIALEIGEDY